MKGYIKYNEQETEQAQDLINQINDCLGFPQPGTDTWDTATAYCRLDSQSAATQFWGYVVKVDTEQLSECLTPQQVENIIQLPSDVYLCGVN
jgi:hypothetical protein